MLPLLYLISTPRRAPSRQGQTHQSRRFRRRTRRSDHPKPICSTSSPSPSPSSRKHLVCTPRHRALVPANATSTYATTRAARSPPTGFWYGSTRTPSSTTPHIGSDLTHVSLSVGSRPQEIHCIRSRERGGRLSTARGTASRRSWRWWQMKVVQVLTARRFDTEFAYNEVDRGKYGRLLETVSGERGHQMQRAQPRRDLPYQARDRLGACRTGVAAGSFRWCSVAVNGLGVCRSWFGVGGLV